MIDDNDIANDELATKAIESAKNWKTYPEGSVAQELAKSVAYQLALNLYVKTKNDTALREWGCSYTEISEIKRGKGKPKKTLFSDRQIVQLVYKQKYQEGLPYTNANDWENNKCFLAVAKFQNRSVNRVIKQYKAVSKNERDKIKEGLKNILQKHGVLHEKYNE